MITRTAAAAVLALAAFTSIDCSEVNAMKHPGVRVAMAQLAVEDGDMNKNIQMARDTVRSAAKQGAELVCLPEAADLGWLWQESHRDAEPIPGKYTQALSSLADELNVWICAGCLEKDGDKVYNSAVLIDRQGRIVLKHRKIETIPDLTAHIYDKGRIEDIKVVDTEFGRLGLTICADNFHLEIPKKVAELGAWLLIAPHGFAAEPDELMENSRNYRTHICKVARETGMWVVGTDAVLGIIKGGAWKGRLHSGCSTIAKPSGEEAVVGKFREPDLVIFEIPASM